MDHPVVKLHCSGCGTTESIEEIRARYPRALSCCPERKMVATCDCGAEFTPKKNSKTCSPLCSRAHTTRRQRAFIKTHPKQKYETEKRYRKSVRRDGRQGRMLNRAVRLLFALTGDIS